uniref:hypothetical protein n=1 Tax=Hassallia byssoidea TaxID=482630 RepID=UPI001F21EDCD
VSEFLKRAKICMHVFPIRLFEIDKASQHKENREYVESIENEVIAQISSRYGVQAILNSRWPKAGRSLSSDVAEYVSQIVTTACP